MLTYSRKLAQVNVPVLLQDLGSVEFSPHQKCQIDQEIKSRFPHILFDQILSLKKSSPAKSSKTLKIGCVLSGGPAPGGHNVILGLFEGLKELNHHNQLIGFHDGLDGFLRNDRLELTHHHLLEHKNLGGFYLLGSSRKKISEEADFLAAKDVVLKEKLDGLVIIGGDDSNTNGAVLADYFIKEKINCQVLGVPKTIDGDLRHEFLEVSFGFDTASKIYSEAVGNILNDAKSAKKYYHFVKIMGRSASHLALETAMNTHPNFTFISEEMDVRPIASQIEELCDMIILRAQHQKNYGCVLIPEGLLEFIPEFQDLISEINSKKITDRENAKLALDPKNLEFFNRLPRSVQNQIFLERDPHGNIPLSQIQTEEVIIQWVKDRLSQKEEEANLKFSAVNHFLGYEGRCGFPTIFDCDYTYALGKLVAKMVDSGLTAYMAGFKNLKANPLEWSPFVIPLSTMMHVISYKGKSKPVIEKTFVDLKGTVYQKFKHSRERYKFEDDYICPGPIQFFGPEELKGQRPLILY